MNNNNIKYVLNNLMNNNISQNDSEYHHCIRPIKNINNICFLTTVVQSLFVCPLFRKIIEELKDGMNYIDNEKYPFISSILEFYHLSYNNVDNIVIVEKQKQKKKDKPIQTTLNIPLENLTKSQRRNLKRRERRRKAQLEQQEELKKCNQSDTTISSKNIKDMNYIKDVCEPTILLTVVSVFQNKIIGRHEDAQEFFNFLIDGLHEELLRLQRLYNVKTKNDSIIDNDNNSNDNNNDDSGWQEVGKKNKICQVNAETTLDKSPISQCFGGRIRWFTNKRGSKSSLSYQPFFSVPIELNSSCITLEDNLKKFIQAQRIDGLNSAKEAYQSCGFDPMFLPNILVVQLKRFQYSSKLQNIVKLQNHVKVSLVLNLYPFLYQPAAAVSIIDSNKEKFEYELISAIIHHGKNLNNGHYTVIIKSKEEYYHLNDSILTRLTVSEFQTYAEQAYVYFYSRRNNVIT